MKKFGLIAALLLSSSIVLAECSLCKKNKELASQVKQTDLATEEQPAPPKE